MEEKSRNRIKFEAGELASMKKRVEHTDLMVRQERGARRRIMARYIKSCCVLASQTKELRHMKKPASDNVGLSSYTSGGDIPSALDMMLPSKTSEDDSVVLDLSDVCLTDEELASLKNALLLYRPVTINIIRLATNFLTDVGAKEMAHFMSTPGAVSVGDLEEIDLRGNSITGAGAKHISDALERNAELGVDQLIVNRDGLLEGLCAVSASNFNPESDAFPLLSGPRPSTAASKIPGMRIAIRVDIRENNPMFSRHGEVTKPSSLAAIFQEEAMLSKSLHRSKAETSTKNGKRRTRAAYGKDKTVKDSALITVYGGVTNTTLTKTTKRKTGNRKGKSKGGKHSSSTPNLPSL